MDSFCFLESDSGGGGGFFLTREDFGENVRQFIPGLLFFFVFFLNGD